jgi:hypothetical protein
VENKPDINQIEMILQNIENKKNQLSQELQDLQVKAGVLSQNIEEMDQVLLQQFSTNDPDELQRILKEKEIELQNLIKQFNQFNQVNENKNIEGSF